MVPQTVTVYAAHRLAIRRRLGRFVRAVRPHHLRWDERREFDQKLRDYVDRMLG